MPSDWQHRHRRPTLAFCFRTPTKALRTGSYPGSTRNSRDVSAVSKALQGTFAITVSVDANIASVSLSNRERIGNFAHLSLKTSHHGRIWRGSIRYTIDFSVAETLAKALDTALRNPHVLLA